MAINPIDAKLATARMRALKAQPYVHAAMYRLRWIPAPEVETVAVDAGWRCYYGPKYVEGQKLEVLAADLLHEVWHLLRGHPERAAAVLGHTSGQLVTLEEYGHLSKRHFEWNCCADCEINDDLAELAKSRTGADGKPDVTPDATFVFPQNFGWPDGETAEQYLARLDKLKAEQGDKGDKDGEGGGGEGKDGKPKPGVGSGRCGGAAGNPTDAERAAEAGATLRGEIVAPMSPAEVKATQLAVAQATKAFAATGQGRGSVPAGLLRWAEEITGPSVVPWERLVRGSIRRAVADVRGQVDYTYQAPSRRAVVHQDVILPALRAPRVKAALVFDTSGSVTERGLGLATREAKGALRHAGVGTAELIAVDAAAAKPVRVVNVRQIKNKLVGGGGTDMRLGIAKALENKRDPANVIVVFTDGDTPWPAEPVRGAKVIAVVINPYTNERPPEWIRTVVINER